MNSLVPELSKVCGARQAEMCAELHALSAQIHRDLALGKASPAPPDVDFLRKAANLCNPPPRNEAGDALLDKQHGIPGSPPALPPVAPPPRRDPDGPQRGNGSTTNAVLGQTSTEGEMRLANDGHAYTY